MLRETTSTTLPEGASPPPKKMTHEELVEERLDLIVQYMHRADRREQWRSVGGFVRTFVALLPMLLFLGSLWYLYDNANAILKRMADQAAQSAAQYSQQSTQSFIDQVKQYLPGVNHSSASSR